MKTRPELTLDDGGHLLHLVRMDGATPANAEIAMLKARTAALTRRTSKMWEDRVAGGRLSMLKMPVLPVQGGHADPRRGRLHRSRGRLGRPVARG